MGLSTLFLNQGTFLFESRHFAQINRYDHSHPPDPDVPQTHH